MTVRNPYPRLCEYHAKVAVLGAFSGRKGHGGGPLTKRVLHPCQLEAIVTEACQRVARDLYDAYKKEEARR